MQSMKDNQVWVLVELLPNGQTVRSKWLFKKKTDMDGYVHTFKARLVAKDYTQTYSVDYGETLSPVAEIRAIRILLAIIALYDHEIWQMDVKIAFQNSHLSEDVYMVQPEGFIDPKHPNREYEFGDLNEPTTYKSVFLDPKSDKWLEVINTEMQSMKDNQVWVLVELLPNGQTVRSKWLFKKKTDMDDYVHTLKLVW
nr:putative retrotransposon Ty1-copia subclass protein [Tanacetum cinerariifolium]